MRLKALLTITMLVAAPAAGFANHDTLCNRKTSFKTIEHLDCRDKKETNINVSRTYTNSDKRDPIYVRDEDTYRGTAIVPLTGLEDMWEWLP